MDVHGKYHKPGGKEREGKRRPNRAEQNYMRTPALEDALATIAIALGQGNRTAARRINSGLDLYVSMILDSSGQMKRAPRSREFRHLSIGAVADYAATGGGGLSKIGATFGSTDRMRKKIDKETTP